MTQPTDISDKAVEATAVTESCGCVFCDLDLTPKWKPVHEHPTRGDGYSICTNPALIAAPAVPVEPVAHANGPVALQFRNGEFLTWIADRLQHVHGENPNYDYMLRLREVAASSAAPPVSPDPALRDARVAEIVSGVMQQHVGPQFNRPIGIGGAPQIDWYALRSELVAALAAAQPGQGG